MVRRQHLAMALAFVFVIPFGCGRVADESAALPASGSAGEARGGDGKGGAGGNGGSIGGVVQVGGTLPTSPDSALPDGCVPTPQADDWGAKRAQYVCFRAADLLVQPHSDRPNIPTLLDPGQGWGGAGELGGASGLGGEAGEAGTARTGLERCPMASELDWSCAPLEGRCCPVPQCESPRDLVVVAEECCYFVFRACGA